MDVRKPAAEAALRSRLEGTRRRGFTVKEKPPKATETTRTPQGTIRRGNRTPYRKGTNAQLEERVEKVIEYLGARPFASDSEIRRELKPFLGVSWRQVGVYIARARAEIRKRCDMSKTDARRRGMEVIVDLLSHKDPNIRLKAEEALAKTHGYRAPSRTEVTGSDGGPIQTEDATPVKRADTKTLEKILELAERGVTPLNHSNGNGNGHAGG